MVSGDLNARTGMAPDFIKNDNGNHFPIYSNYSPDLDIPDRCSMDKVINSRGKQLNELCIQSGLRILNGRFFGDSLGRFTSHQPMGSSVIDYFVVSESLLSYINFFKVHEFDGNMSDHCKVSIMLSVNCFIHVVDDINLNTLASRYIWEEDSPYKFQEALK